MAPVLYRGIRGGPAVTESRLLENGHIFEGEEVDVAEPRATFDWGQSFAITFWVYIAYFDQNVPQTLFCRQEVNR